MPHQEQGQGRSATVISLDEYRECRNKRVPRVEIEIQGGGKIEYDTPGVDDDNVFQALVGCYVVAGKLLQRVSERMKRCGTNGCGPTE